MSASVDRRTLLVSVVAVGGLGALTACTSSAEPGPTSALPSPSALDAVVADEAALIGQYDAAIAAYPDLAAALEPVRQHHVEHAAALSPAGANPPSAPPATAAPTTDGALAALIAAEREAGRARVAACVDEPDAAVARTLAFIAASESAHVPYLRDLRP